MTRRVALAALIRWACMGGRIGFTDAWNSTDAAGSLVAASGHIATYQWIVTSGAVAREPSFEASDQSRLVIAARRHSRPPTSTRLRRRKIDEGLTATADTLGTRSRSILHDGPGGTKSQSERFSRAVPTIRLVPGGHSVGLARILQPVARRPAERLCADRRSAAHVESAYVPWSGTESA